MDKLWIVLITASLTILINLVFFRLNLNLIDKKKTDEANNRLVLLCDYLLAVIINDDKSVVESKADNKKEDCNEFIKLLVAEYGFLISRNSTVIDDYNKLMSIIMFYRSNGYLNNQNRKTSDVQEIMCLKGRVIKKIIDRNNTFLHKAFLIFH